MRNAMMASPLKRAYTPSSRSISPPAVRRKLSSGFPTKGADFEGSGSDRPREHIKIMSWNVNGVGPLLQKRISFDSTASLYPLRTFLRKHGWPECLCLQEVKINAKDNATQERLQQAANEGASHGEPEYNIVFSLPRDKYNATGFGGRVHGVCSLMRQGTLLQVQATRKPDWDLEGRVLIHELSNRLVLINGYWVNGTSAPYRDPTTGEPHGDRHALKLSYHRRILDEVLAYERRGCQVILVGDMNVARQTIDGYPNLRTSPDQHVKNRSDFNQKFFHDDAGMKGIDVFRQVHRNRKKYTYWPRNRPWGSSMDRVDLIIASRALVERDDAIVDTDICDNQADRGHSDHVPFWVVMKLTSEDLASTNSHGMSSQTLIDGHTDKVHDD